MSSKDIQREVFLSGEGDGYFQRNRAALERSDDARQLVINRISHHIGGMTRPRVLEIGCATGGNLAALSALNSIDGVGIDPSADAIRAGTSQFPTLSLHVGTADELRFQDASFDLVWFGFCLYLVDRPLLHRVVSECDRVLRDGGLLVIYDFDPDAPCVRQYRHAAGLNSYKMDYSRLFLADPAYSLNEKVSFSHHGQQWCADPQERLGLWICRKHLQSAYRSS